MVARDLCPSNTPLAISTVNPVWAKKVLPPIKATSSSLERTTGLTSNGAATFLQPQKRATMDLERVADFKKRDLRGGKLTRHSNASVGKKSLLKTSQASTAHKTDRKIASIAMGSPST